MDRIARNKEYLTRLFSAPPADCVRMFSDRAVIMMGYTPGEQMNELLHLAGDKMRYLFNLDAIPLDAARPLYERLRSRCPRLA